MGGSKNRLDEWLALGRNEADWILAADGISTIYWPGMAIGRWPEFGKEVVRISGTPPNCRNESIGHGVTQRFHRPLYIHRTSSLASLGRCAPTMFRRERRKLLNVRG